MRIGIPPLQRTNVSHSNIPRLIYRSVQITNSVSMQSSIDLLSNQAKCNAEETRSKHQRPDFISHLQGLRGLAILMILLFHLLPDYFSQGFLGVEVFLVISGYLLFRGWKEGERFNPLTFSKKKFERIIPLICLLVITTIGIFSTVVKLENVNLRFLCNAAITSLFGISNEYYISRYSDYFSPGANMNPLLHTWYISVTLQIYITWALGAWILWRMNKKIRIAIVGVVAIISFCYDYRPEIQSILNFFGADLQISNDASYYGTVNRVWQILAGGIVTILPARLNKLTANLISSLSLLILLSVAYCNYSMGSASPIIVTACAVLILWSFPSSNVKKITELPPLTWLGAISFSLYIVHFPIIVFYKYWERELPTISTAFLIILPFILIISYSVWYFIERRKFNFRATLITLFLAALIALFGRYNEKMGFDTLPIPYPAYTGVVRDVHPDALHHYDVNNLPATNGTAHILSNKINIQFKPIMGLGIQTSPPEYILLGDSHAQHLYAGFNSLSERLGISGGHFTTIIIPFWDRYVHHGGSYYWDAAKAQALLYWLRKHPETHTVVISQAWHVRLGAKSYANWKFKQQDSTFEVQTALLRKFCDEIKRAGKQVVLVSPTPTLFKFKKEIHGTGLEYFNWLHRRGKDAEDRLPAPFIMTEAEYREKFADILAFQSDWENEGFCQVLHVEKGIFRQGDFLGCRDGVLRIKDDGHITPPESVEMLEIIADDFSRILEAGRALQKSSTH